MKTFSELTKIAKALDEIASSLRLSPENNDTEAAKLALKIGKCAQIALKLASARVSQAGRPAGRAKHS